MSRIADIADALVEELNGSSFSQAFTAVRSTLPRMKREELGDTLWVSVIPGDWTTEMETRTEWKESHPVTVFFQKGLQQGIAEEQGEVDALVDLIEEVAGHCKGLILSVGDARAVCTAMKVLACEPNDLTVYRAFTGALMLTFTLSG